MRKSFGPLARFFVAAFVALFLSGCGYNDLQRQDEQIKAAWSEVINQYQRRADLVPNLVNTVKGYAAQEQTIFIQVAEARANVGSIKATPELINDPVAFAKFQAAQAQLQSALSRLLLVAENYPQLKSDAVFRDLTAMIFKMDVKPNFTVDNEKTISVPPTVDFGKSPTPPATSPAPASPPKN